MNQGAAEETRRALRERDAAGFTTHMLLGRTPIIFSSLDQYLSWKTALALGIEVDPHQILIVGSACLGVTLNPKKELFREFGPQSDIDVAVVSPRHFDIAWKRLRDIGHVGGSIPTSAEKHIRKTHREFLVFDGTIATDQILGFLPFGQQWSEALDEAARRPPTEGRQVKTRIYRDVESLRQYHERNVQRLKLTHSRDLVTDLTDLTPEEESAPILSVDGDTDPTEQVEG